ncbi:hypothetical protein [Brucella anthropi]|uniref:hypothetical protein n=1 Tax=Brucella anthropi TaxID=529 RepID=UPI00124C0AFE|nr:hypothetical protein [Brucella anthropi]KAB2752255.1 hypothetical protein F9L05_03845 [Brucella anthropi]
MYARLLKTLVEVAPSNVTPVWVLFYWRLLKGKAEGDHAEAWSALPEYLPSNIRCPTLDEAAVILVDHGLI